MTGRMPLLLEGLEHIFANLDLEQQTRGGNAKACAFTTIIPDTCDQLIQKVHGKLMELPEVVELVGAINRYASAKFAEFAGSVDDDAMIR